MRKPFSLIVLFLVVAALFTAGCTSIDQKPPASDETIVRTVQEGGSYTGMQDVADYIHIYGKLPSNFITKKQALELGWKSDEGNLHVVAPGKSIGGDTFGNREGLLPSEKGRKYYECDINYEEGFRGAERIIYSSDGLVFYTSDHYRTFAQLY